MPVATPVTTTQIRQLSDGNTAGTVLGKSAADNIGFYGDSQPVPQPSGAAQAALTRGLAGGILAVAATSQTPAFTSIQTSREVGITLGVNTAPTTGANFNIASGDLLYVNKPTAQAGLGIGNVRVSGSNVAGVTFANYGTTTVTPTAGEKYGVVAVRGLPTIAATLTPAAVAAGTIVEQQFTVTGLRAGELVQVSKPTSQNGLDIVGCRVVSANLLGITYANMQATTAIVPTAGESYTVFSLGGLDAHGPLITAQTDVGAIAAGTGTTTTEAGITLTGLAVTDIIVGVSKPTAQTGLGIVGARVSGAGVLGVTFGNFAGAVSATTNEVYEVTMIRPAPVAPMVLYGVTLTPAAVAPSTTAEQTFTVTGVVASSPVWVNKPSYTPGLGIAGVRATSTVNVIGINFVNNTAATITPPSETYLIGNFQQPIPDGGNTWLFPVTPQIQQNVLLSNAIRAALAGAAGLNLIAGA